MAINPIHLLAASTAKATNGSNIIEVFGSIDASRVYQGSVITLGTFAAVEGISGTAPNSDGNSTITLFEPWPEVTTTARLTAFNSLEGLTGAIEKSRQVVAATSSIEAISGTGLLEKTGTDAYAVTPITAQAKLLLDDINSQEQRDTLELGNVDNTSDELKPVSSVQRVINAAMSKAEFFALAEKNKRFSGFSEFGKHQTENSSFGVVNEGMWTNPAVSNNLRLGRASPNDSGASRTNVPILISNGITHSINHINNSTTNENLIKLPPAPNGLKTYNKATGAVVTHANIATAFGSETADNKVIISRQDFALVESFHEAIEDKGVVYPLGNSQYGLASYKGISLSNSLVAQGYSAFGEWDTETRGYGVQWSTLTDAQKIIFVQEPENNIYFDPEVGKHIQVRYRVRVVEGLGDSWFNVSTQKIGNSELSYGNNSTFVRVRGSKTTNVSEFNDSSDSFYGTSFGSWGSDSLASGSSGLFIGVGSNGLTSDNLAHNGLCFAVPIALIQRRNQGAYHPAYNSNGTKAFNTSGSGINGNKWYATTLEPSNTVECFNSVNSENDSSTVGAAQGTGEIGAFSGRVDGKFFDAIYASDVKDLRMSSEILPVDEVREKYKRMAIAGEVRGFEGVPFTKVFALNNINNSNEFLDIAVADRPFILEFGQELIGKIVYVEHATDGSYLKRTINSVGSVGQFIRTVESNTNTKTNSLLVIGVSSTHKQANPSWTDIVGDPARILATYPDGVEGQWLPTIPDGTNTLVVILNRKETKDYGSSDFIQTVNDGVSWSALDKTTITTTNSFNVNSANSADGVTLVHYETQAHFTKDDVNSKVLSLGGMFASNRHEIKFGAAITSSLINKMPTNAVSGNLQRHAAETEIKAVILEGYISDAVAMLPYHDNLDLYGVDSPTLKTLDYLSSENNVAKLVYAYKEMVYDTTFGDNNQFEIVDNQATLTDDNGNSVLHGAASFDTQYFIVEK
jgi:hypothetical protein